MKRFALLACILLLLFASAAAETVSAYGMSFDKNASAVDFGDKWFKELNELEAMLDQMPNVTRVLMYRPRLTADEMAHLTERYPHIFFGWTLRIRDRDNDHLIRTDATAFSTLHNGKSHFHSERDFDILRYCPNLLGLDIGHNVVTDISFLRYWPNLRVLILGRNSISDISVLAELHDLEYLEIFSNQLTDISALAGLDRLLDLCITNNQITDLSPLYGLTNLQRLWCATNRLSPEQYAELREHLPNCEINDIDTPTGGTWRKHDRYFVIKDMFHKGVYIPFEQ